MKIIKRLLIAILVVIGLFIMIGLMMSKDYTVERSVAIDTPAAQIHPYVNDLEKWADWSPFMEEDPSIEITFGKITSGVGASQEWMGKSGGGSMEITSSDPAKGIQYDFEATDVNGNSFGTAVGKMTYEEKDGKTTVTWSMNGTNEGAVLGGYVAKIMDSMVGPLFEHGLAHLKDVAEGKKKTEPAGK